jgi:8-oxo-dGTP pyrophosphatase MutT (NUDIX family)
MKGMKEKEVVVCFLEYGGKILIMKRNTKADVYGGKWGAVIGYIEWNEWPYQTALREIKEETGLLASDVRLVREAEVMYVPDNEIKTRWVIYPSRFEAGIDRITLNGEHERSEWIEPGELNNFDTVPQLGEVLKTVLEKEKSLEA